MTDNTIESCKVYNRKETIALIGVSEKSFTRLEAIGDAPPKVRLSAGRIGYRAADISAWLTSRYESPGSPARPTRLQRCAMTNNKDTDLIERLNAAVKAADEAQAQVGTANAELISRPRRSGLLLLEAKKLHPKVKDFDAFIQKVHGLQLSRAYDLLRLAGGRTTDEELKKDARERKQKSRAKKKQRRSRGRSRCPYPSRKIP